MNIDSSSYMTIDIRYYVISHWVLSLMLPSGKLLHNYGTSPFLTGIYQLFNYGHGFKLTVSPFTRPGQSQIILFNHHEITMNLWFSQAFLCL